MDKAIVLAVAASVCTAASSVCQRMGAKGMPGGLTWGWWSGWPAGRSGCWASPA
jgi:hypothetical protein